MKRLVSTSLISRWKKTFARGKNKPVREESSQQEKLKTTETTIILNKKETVSFQLSRLNNPKDFERMAFVAKVCLKYSDSQIKTILHVEQTRTGSRLVATDGHRLHVAEISKKIKSGNYKPVVTKDTIILGKPVTGIKFPVWAKAIPEKMEKRGVINLADTGLGKDRKENEKLSLVFNSFVKQTGEPVNVRYLEDLTKRVWIIYCQNEKRRAIILKENGKPNEKNPVAVILPIPQAA